MTKKQLRSAVARRVTVRIVAATHRNLAQMVEHGEFRQDLYFRLNAVTIEVPPLRERPAARSRSATA